MDRRDERVPGEFAPRGETADPDREGFRKSRRNRPLFEASYAARLDYRKSP